MLTGDARLEFLRNSARRLKMRERIERAGLSNLLSARSLPSHKGASKMLRATGHGHARMVTRGLVGYQPTSAVLLCRGDTRPARRAARSLRFSLFARTVDGYHPSKCCSNPPVLNRSPIIFKNLQIKSKLVKEGMNRRIFHADSESPHMT